MKIRAVLLFLFILMVFGSFIRAQSGVRLSYIKHVSDHGIIFKPTVGLEYIRSHSDFYDKFRNRSSIGLYFLQTRQDTIHSFAAGYRNGQFNLLPATDDFVYYVSIILGEGFDWRILDKNFSPLIGADAYLQLIAFSKRSVVKTLIDEEGGEAHAALSVMPKAGFSFAINKSILLQAGLGKSIGVELGPNYVAPNYFWKPFIELIYYP